MRPVLVLLLAALVGLAACGPPPFIHKYKDEPDPRSNELVLGVGDVIAVNVWENKDFNTEATIRPDGTITMPLIGDVNAAGQTPSSLKGLIKEKLGEFVKQTPGTELVTIAVRAWRSYKFTIQGEVSRQGVYSSEGFVTVADALAMAGGLTRFARRAEVKIFRWDPKTKKTRQIPLDYDQISSGKRLDMNIWVLAGDVISVP